MGLSLEFWGVRGSIACPSPRHVQFGGNTSCIEVFAGERRIILDAGTGLRSLGKKFLREGQREATLLLTHVHWDHINGFPFFAPGFVAGHHFEIYSGQVDSELSLRDVIAGQMSNPTFPVPLDAMRSELAFHELRHGDCFQLEPGVEVRTARLNHPNGATGYRIEHAGKSLVYVTDTEHVPGVPDQNVLALIEGADLVIYDSTYTDEEYVRHVGWGHSTWQEAVRLCRAAGAKRLAIFHHDPEHEDDFMAQVELDAQAQWEGAFVARERMRIDL